MLYALDGGLISDLEVSVRHFGSFAESSEFSFTLIVAACPAGFAFAFSDHSNEDEINRLTSEFSFTFTVAACPAGFAFAFS